MSKLYDGMTIPSVILSLSCSNNSVEEEVSTHSSICVTFGGNVTNTTVLDLNNIDDDDGFCIRK